MRKRYATEFKLRIARLIVSGEKRCTDVCREWCLASGMVSRWVQEYHERGDGAWEKSDLPCSLLSIDQRLLILERDHDKLEQISHILSQ